MITILCLLPEFGGPLRLSQQLVDNHELIKKHELVSNNKIWLDPLWWTRLEGPPWDTDWWGRRLCCYVRYIMAQLDPSRFLLLRSDQLLWSPIDILVWKEWSSWSIQDLDQSIGLHETRPGKTLLKAKAPFQVTNFYFSWFFSISLQLGQIM